MFVWQGLITGKRDYITGLNTIYTQTNDCSLYSDIPQTFLSKPQPNLNTTVRFDLKMTLHTTPPPHPTQTQCQQYLSCYLSDFDETLKVGSCERLEQIPTVMVIFVQATFVLATFVHIRNISALTYPILMKL